MQVTKEQLEASQALFDKLNELGSEYLGEAAVEAKFTALAEGYSLSLKGLTYCVKLGWPVPDLGYEELLRAMSSSNTVVEIGFDAKAGEIAHCALRMAGMASEVAKQLLSFISRVPHIVHTEPALGRTTAGWFSLVRPKPTADHFRAQFAVHLEEISEMLGEVSIPNAGETVTVKIGDSTQSVELPDPQRLMAELHILSLALRQGKTSIEVENLQGFVDSFLDQRVTAIGCLHNLKVPVDAAVAEVDESNFSKFVEGLPVFDQTGKVVKGPDYRKPVLENFLGAPTFDKLYD